MPTDIKGKIDSNTIIVGYCNTPLIPLDRSAKQKINKKTQVLNDTLNEMDFIDIFRTLHPNAEENTFFSNAHGSFSRINHISGHKTSHKDLPQKMVNLRKLKLYQASSWSTILLD